MLNDADPAASFEVVKRDWPTSDTPLTHDGTPVLLKTKGRRILFLDTCHSGSAYSAKLGNATYHANIITYASARFDQEAIEDATLGHGLFTYALGEALQGEGEFAAKREITTKSLHEYVVKRVETMARAKRGEQQPQYFRARDAEDYVLARW